MRRSGKLFLLTLLAFGVGRRVFSQHRSPSQRIAKPGTHISPSTSRGTWHRPSDIPYGYDVRTGSAAYAPIIGTIGGFVVTAVVLLFEIISSHHGATAPFGRAASLLVLGLISCLLGAFACAGIGAERKLTSNLPAAALYAGAATAIGVVAIIAAFEVLASIYLRETKPLFAMITAGTAIAASVLVALILGDVWLAEPQPKHWLATREKAYFWGTVSSGTAALILLIGTAAYFAGGRIALGQSGTHWFVGSGIVLAVIGGLGSMFRTMHAPDDRSVPISKVETLAVLGCLVAYLLALLLSMP